MSGEIAPSLAPLACTLAATRTFSVVSISVLSDFVKQREPPSRLSIYQLAEPSIHQRLIHLQENKQFSLLPVLPALQPTRSARLRSNTDRYSTGIAVPTHHELT